MTIRPYDPEIDLDAVRCIWRECGWLDGDDTTGMDMALEGCNTIVALADDRPECCVNTLPGDIKYLDETLPFGLVAGVTTSHVGKRQGLASRTTARGVANEAEAGAAVIGLGAFETGFYDRLGFGTGEYDYFLDFDPQMMRLPDGVRARPPKRFSPEDGEAIHAARLRRMRGHGSCNFADHRITTAELCWRKNKTILGYTDGSNGEISHALTMSPRDFGSGPMRVWWMAYETWDQFLELMALVQNLGDQIRVIEVAEPVGVMIQDFVDRPFRMINVTRGAAHPHNFWFAGWWQMRIADMEACFAATKLSWMRGDTVRFNVELDDPIAERLDAGSSWTGVGGSWTIELGQSSSATRGATAGLPVMRAGVGAFTRMWLGVRPASGLAVTDAIDAPPALLAALDDAFRVPRPNPDWEF
ncbi:MAG: GNAT family N-acetyltransferase [Planctomycetota bacterium]